MLLFICPTVRPAVIRKLLLHLNTEKHQNKVKTEISNFSTRLTRHAVCRPGSSHQAYHAICTPTRRQPEPAEPPLRPPPPTADKKEVYKI